MYVQEKTSENIPSESEESETFYSRPSKLDSECGVPSIPPFRGIKPNENPIWYNSLSEVEGENPLDTTQYPTPPHIKKKVKELCGNKESVKEKVECVGDWVHEYITYDNVHCGLSSGLQQSVVENNRKNYEIRNLLTDEKIEGGDALYNEPYPMHRYLNSKEALESGYGICGELSESVVALLRSMDIPAMLYRPFKSHFRAIAEDTENKQFYVYDAMSPSAGCSITEHHEDPEKPPQVVTKRWDPNSHYTFGVTPYDEFVAWTLGKRRILGTAKACQLIAGTHNEDSIREGYFTDEGGNFDVEKLSELNDLYPDIVEVKERIREIDDQLEKMGWFSKYVTNRNRERELKAKKIKLNKIKELWENKIAEAGETFLKKFKSCADYLDEIYEDSLYYDISYDTENILANPPSKELIEMFDGKEIVDLEHAGECREIPLETDVGLLVEFALNRECGRQKRTIHRDIDFSKEDLNTEMEEYLELYKDEDMRLP